MTTFAGGRPRLIWPSGGLMKNSAPDILSDFDRQAAVGGAVSEGFVTCSQLISFENREEARVAGVVTRRDVAMAVAIKRKTPSIVLPQTMDPISRARPRSALSPRLFEDWLVQINQTIPTNLPDDYLEYIAQQQVVFEFQTCY
jgi:hypothetical protein